MNGNNSESKQYAETSALSDWSTQLNKINDEAVEILSKFANEVNNINDSWKGNAATGFINSSNDVVNIAKNLHNGMRDTDTFLVTVAQHMEER